MCNKLYICLSRSPKSTTNHCTTDPLIHRSTDPLPQSPMPPNHEFVYEKKIKIFIYQLTEPIKFNRLLYAKCEQKSNEINQNQSEMESQSNRINQHIELIDQINQTIDQQCRLQMINHLNKSNQIQSHACVCVCPATVSVNQPRARTYTHA